VPLVDKAPPLKKLIIIAGETPLTIRWMNKSIVFMTTKRVLRDVRRLTSSLILLFIIGFIYGYSYKGTISCHHHHRTSSSPSRLEQIYKVPHWGHKVPSGKASMSTKASSVTRDKQGNTITTQVCASPAEN